MIGLTYSIFQRNLRAIILSFNPQSRLKPSKNQKFRKKNETTLQSARNKHRIHRYDHPRKNRAIVVRRVRGGVQADLRDWIIDYRDVAVEERGLWEFGMAESDTIEVDDSAGGNTMSNERQDSEAESVAEWPRREG